MAIDKLLICTCAATMKLDPERLGRAVGATETTLCTRLCRNEVEIAKGALESGGRVLLACGQEVATFEALADDADAADRLVTVDIRDRAGWTDDGGDPTAKQAALLAEAGLARPATPLRDVTSEGICLVLGADDTALEAAARLAEVLTVTCLLAVPPDAMLPDPRFDVALGRLRSARGALGRFAVTVDGYAPTDPAGRGEIGFERPRDGAESTCDLILDLTGAAPLFPAPEKRDGYLRADPGDPGAVARAVFDAAQLVGTFEKPLHIRFHPELCAHSRARQDGCTRCLDVCPTGAILPAGDTVAIDPFVCAGCGACAAVCPSGAAEYDDPPVEFLFRRLRTLAQVYIGTAGSAPRALFHDAGHGAEMIRLGARFGRGLPADVVPVEVPNVEGVGHAELLAALGCGFAEALVLAGPRADRSALAPQLELARSILTGTGHAPERIELIEPADPDALADMLFRSAAPVLGIDPILPVGGRRETVRLAATALAGTPAAPIALPDGASYGAIVIDKEACTLCLACVSLCPAGALADNPDRPQVRLQETACLQCGICANACPEDAITLVPQLDLSPSALAQRVLHEEEPFDCIECGRPFGVRSTIERIVARLKDKHWMYTNSDNIRLVQMCDDCRVRAQYHATSSPFRMGDRPRVRTADDDRSGNGST